MSKKNRGGRPTVMTADVLAKLEDAFMNAFTDEMASLYAGISPDALYDYCNANPKFSDRKETLKKTPDLIAQKTLIGDLTNTGGARWWAEHRMKEFKPKSEIDLTPRIPTDGATNEEARKLAKEYEEKLRAAIVAGQK